MLVFRGSDGMLTSLSARFDDMKACEAARFESFKHEKADDPVRVAIARCLAAASR